MEPTDKPVFDSTRLGEKSMRWTETNHKLRSSLANILSLKIPPELVKYGSICLENFKSEILKLFILKELLCSKIGRSVKEGLNNLRIKCYHTIQTSSVGELSQTTLGQYAESTNKLVSHLQGRGKKEPI